MHVAAVDIGTNSTRLLVADIDDGRVNELLRLTNVTRLGEGVDRDGRLSEAAIGRVSEACEHYRAEIDRLGAERTLAVLTSAVRDSANGDQFAAMLRDRFGFEADEVSGEREAEFTYRGATSQRDRNGSLLVIDIGGGSTEFVIGSGEQIDFNASTQIGSVRFTERYLRSDPPTADQVTSCRAAIRTEIETAVEPAVRAVPRAAIAVAGTPTSFAAIEQRLVPYDREKVHGYVLSSADCVRIADRLASMPVAERRGVPGLHPGRAPTIVAGGLILVEALALFGLASVEVSEADILDGAALYAAANL